jgi:hypothetical protein
MISSIFLRFRSHSSTKNQKVQPMPRQMRYGGETTNHLSPVAGLRLRIVVAVLIVACCSKVWSADARLVITANVVCSVSAQFGQEKKVTIVAANCSDPSQRDSTVIIPGRQSGMTMTLQRQPAMQVSVETRRVQVHNRSGHLEERTIRTTTVIPE